VDVALDDAGDLYVADATNHRIARWSPDGFPRGWIGGGSDGWKTREAEPEDPDDEVPGDSGRTLRHFTLPESVRVTSDGDLYVADAILDRVSVWSTDGAARAWIGGGVERWNGDARPLRGGPDHRRFDGPRGLALTTGGLLYVADAGNDRVSRWRIR
jgi:DNA-binding beta-propeller fold protein YncE